MARPAKDPLRVLSSLERECFESISRSFSEPAAHVARAKALLAVSEGANYTEAAHRAGRRSNDAVSRLVSRFNVEGLRALEGHYENCGKAPYYSEEERRQILQTFEQEPDREHDGCAQWSLMLLRKRLRKEGLPHVSTYTIHEVLHEAGYTWQQDRSWCKTGEALRKRKTGIEKVIDPDSEPKKTDRRGLHNGNRSGSADLLHRSSRTVSNDSLSRKTLV
jgi:transposase